MTCTACDDRNLCRQTFICQSCRKRLNTCHYRVGKTRECVSCWELRVLGPVWVARWSKSKMAVVHQGSRS